MRETLQGHLREGHQLELVLPQYDIFSNTLEPLYLRENPGYRIHTASCRWMVPVVWLRYRIQSVSRQNELPYLARWLINMTILICLSFSLTLKVKKIGRKKFKPDLVYAHNQYAAFSGYLIRLLWGIPNVTRLYGTFLADLMKKPLVIFRYPTAVAGYLVPSALLICANDGTRGDEVARRLRVSTNRFRFWQNGVKPPSKLPKMTRQEFIEQFKLKAISDSPWVISCSRLSSWKRIDRILNAVKICLEMDQRVHLLVAGDGPEKESLENLALTLGIDEHVSWIGAIAHDKIWALMNLADVFMITNDVTNRCNPIYEAAWAGLPVVSVVDPSTKDLLIHGKNALLSRKKDPDALGGNLAELLSQKKMRIDFQENQIELSKSFWTWKERMQTEVGEIEKLVNTWT